MMEHYGVKLRELNTEDIPALWELYTPAIFEHMLTKVANSEELTAWLKAGVGRTDVLSFVVEEAATGRIIGTTRIALIDRQNKSCEIGSTFYAESMQSTHVNTATKRMLLSYCFEEMDMIRNERIRSTGKPRDAVLYSIIDTEWLGVKKRMNDRLNKYA